jgi:hypothetical protein
MAQPLRVPDIEVQRAAMRKLGFLVGKWSGEARLLRGPGEPTVVAQTEEARYELDGLILTIQGIGRTTADNKPVLQAFGVVSYDDETGTYHMRAYNDGRYLETEVKLLDGAARLTWGFALGPYKTSSVLRINEKGEWTELHDIATGTGPSRKLMELTVKRVK